MSRRTAIFAALSCLTLAVVVWRVMAVASAIPPHYVALVDRSTSRLSSCTGLDGVVMRVLEDPRLRRGSTLTVLGTGDSSRSPEPHRLWSGEVPVDNRVFESKARRAEHRRQFAAEIVEHCRQASPTSASPIFLGMKRALEQLRALACGADSTCAIYVTSDGDETAEPRIARAMRARSRTTVLPEPLANDGIRVLMCGFAETASARGGQPVIAGGVERADRVRQVWSALVSDPELLTLEPFCYSKSDVTRRPLTAPTERGVR